MVLFFFFFLRWWWSWWIFWFFFFFFLWGLEVTCDSNDGCFGRWCWSILMGFVVGCWWLWLLWWWFCLGFFCRWLWLPQWWWWGLMVAVLGFLQWVVATTMVLVVVNVAGGWQKFQFVGFWWFFFFFFLLVVVASCKGWW